MEVFTNVHVGGQLSMKSISMPAGSVVAEDFASDAACQASKFQTQNAIEYSQPQGSDITDDECLAHICRLPTEIIAIEVTPIVPPSAPAVVVTTIQSGRSTNSGANLSAWWKLEEASGTRSDSVGTSHLAEVGGTINNATGVQGNAADFTAAEARDLEVATNSALHAADGGDLTVAMWFKLGAFGAGNITPAILYDGASHYSWVFQVSNAGVLKFITSYRDGTGSLEIAWGSALSLGQWYFVVGVIDETTGFLKISVNGGAFVTAAEAEDLGYAGEPTGMKLYVAGGFGYMTGVIDELAIWQRALPIADVQDLYAEGVGTTYPPPSTRNEKQLVTLTNGPIGGTFTLTYAGQTTAATAYNASAATVDTNLENLSNIAASDLTTTGSAGGPWTVEFGGTLANTNVGEMTGSASGLTAPAVNYSVDVGIRNANANTFTSILTADIDINSASAARTPIAATIDSALKDLQPGDVLVVLVTAGTVADAQGVNVVIHSRSYP